MYSNMKYYENICNCFRVIQQDINRKLKSANCWQQTSLNMIWKVHYRIFLGYTKISNIVLGMHKISDIFGVPLQTRYIFFGGGGGTEQMLGLSLCV